MGQPVLSIKEAAVQKFNFRNNIVHLQDVLLAQPNCITAEESEQDYVTTYFAPGTYGRKIFIAAGMCVVGKIHKHAHLNILMHGKCKVVTETGSETLEGPHIWTSEPGTKRAVFALTDLEWVTIHDNPENKTDIAELEKDIIAPDYESFDKLNLELGDIA
jgi:hypothetical protein